MPTSAFPLIRAVFWCSVIALAIGSLVPVELLPRQATTIWDKGQHAFGFAWLATFGLFAYPNKPWHMVTALLLYGGAIELVQAATGWRFGEWLDFLANGIGICIGTAIWLAVRFLTSPQR